MSTITESSRCELSRCSFASALSVIVLIGWIHVTSTPRRQASCGHGDSG
jgi:hypothetical protein